MSTRSTRRASRSISVAYRRSPASISLVLPWLSRRGSSFIWGVWHDAKHVADHIVTQRKYLAYRDVSQRAGMIVTTMHHDLRMRKDSNLAREMMHAAV